MRKGVFYCFTVLGFVLFAGTASAQATRTWVSGVGDDANPCSRTAPCKTFAGAISKTAPSGTIDVLDPGGFGALTITKAITIENVGEVGGVLVVGTNGFVIAAGTSDDVIVRGLSFDGMGATPGNTGLNAIRFISGNSLVVENTSIRRFSQSGIDFEPSGSSHLFVRNCTISDTGGPAILVKPSGVGGFANASIEDTAMRHGQAGLRVEDNSIVAATHCVSSGNTNNGYLAFSNGANLDVTLDGCEASSNNTNGVATSGVGANLRFSNCVISGNTTGVNQISGHLFTYGSNQINGNGTDIGGSSPTPIATR